MHRVGTKRKTKTLTSTLIEIVNSLHVNVVDIDFVSDLWTTVRKRVTYNVIEVIGIDIL